MAYQTATLTGSDDLEDLHGILRTFAVAQGWTAANDTWPYLNLTKGACSANLWFRTDTVLNDLHGPGASTTAPDHTVNLLLGTSYGGSGGGSTRFFSQPGYCGDLVSSNDWTGTYDRYWLFANNTGPNYIHMLVRKTNGRFAYLGFGELDKKGLTYTGGAFAMGIRWNWGFNTNTHNVATGYSNTGSSPFGANHHMPFDSNLMVNDSTLQVRLNSGAPHEIISNRSTNPWDDIVSLWGRNGDLVFSPSGLMPAVFADQARWLGSIFHLGPNPINNSTILFEPPVLVFDGVSGNDRAYYMGSVPGVRYCSMLGRVEAETVAFGSDDWVVFPFKRYSPWIPEPYAARQNTSGPYGHAFKIVP